MRLNSQLSSVLISTEDGTILKLKTADYRSITRGVLIAANLRMTGYGHTVKIVETSAGTVTGTKQFVWDNIEMKEIRDASGNTTAQLFATLGEAINGTSYLYTTDFLGSINELVNSAGVVQAQYAYDSYGRVNKIAGAIDSDLQYAGYYVHERSGLNVAVNRCYSSAIGRWINRDPAQETGGINLFAYVNNDPICGTDPSGLQSAPAPSPTPTPTPSPPGPGDGGGTNGGTILVIIGGIVIVIIIIIVTPRPKPEPDPTPPTPSLGLPACRNQSCCASNFESCRQFCSANRSGEAYYRCIQCCDTEFTNCSSRVRRKGYSSGKFWNNCCQ